MTQCSILKVRDAIMLQKGKPPALIPYFGHDALYYLTPEYLRGNAEPELVLAGTNAVLVDDGDIIILWDGSNAGEILLGKRGILSSTMCKALVNAGIEQQYLFYALKNIETFLKNQTSGSGIPHVDKEILGNISILKFRSSEQTQIAGILSTIDKAIEQTEAIIAKQQRIKTGLMQDLLTCGIDEAGNIRSEATHQFKDSPLGRIPVEWDVDKLSRGIISSAFGPRFPSTAYSSTGNIALLRTTDLDDDGNISYGNMPLAQLNLESFSSHLLKKYDLLISRSGTIGIPSVYENFYLPVIPGAFLIRFRLEESQLNPFYVRYIFNEETGRKRLLELADGGVQKNIRGSAVNSMLFCFPEIAEQQRIVDAISSYDKGIHGYKTELDKFRKQKTGLMQDLLTGKVRVTNLLNPSNDQ